MAEEFALVSLPALIDELSQTAATASNGRAARTITGGASRALRQTVIVLEAGEELSEHDSPGEATLQVVSGSVEFSSEGASAVLEMGDVLQIPPRRHAVRAPVDAALLLTVVTSAATE